MHKHRHSAVYASLLAAAWLYPGCGGTTNLVDCSGGQHALPCNPQTPDEQAQADLNAGQYTAGITELTTLIGADPTTYRRYPLLASGYAARAGFNLLNLAEAQFGGSGDLLTQFSTIIPTPATTGAAAYPDHVADMQAAVGTLHAIPTALIASTTASDFAASAILQLTLYQSAYAIMLIDEFAVSATTGKLDPSQLATMTEAQAETVITSLLAAGQVPGVSNSAAVQAKVAAAVAAINAEPGATTKDKLANYIAATQGSGSGTGTGSSGSSSSGESSGTGP